MNDYLENLQFADMAVGISALYRADFPAPYEKAAGGDESSII